MDLRELTRDFTHGGMANFEEIRSGSYKAHFLRWELRMRLDMGGAGKIWLIDTG